VTFTGFQKVQKSNNPENDIFNLYMAAMLPKIFFKTYQHLICKYMYVKRIYNEYL